MIFTFVLGVFMLASGYIDIYSHQYYLLSFDLFMACLCFAYSFTAWKYRGNKW